MSDTPRRRLNPLAIVLLAVALFVLVVGGANAWAVWGTTALARPEAEARVAELREGFAAATPAAAAVPLVEQPQIGEPAWVLRIDSLELAWPIVAGVEPEQLASGLGWYPGSALPGQVGNFALAGQRIGHGQPFARLLELAVGAEIVVETPSASFTYTVIHAPADLTVTADDSWVLDPVPGQADAEPTQAFLTLTTAEDLFPTADRSVGFATLTATETR